MGLTHPQLDVEIIRLPIQKLIFRSIDLYNRYRSPEEKAKLLELKEDSFTLEFEGPFCHSCGVQYYFEDFIHELETINAAVKVEIQTIEQTSPQSYIVKFKFVDNLDEVFRDFLQEKGLSIRGFLAHNPCTKDMIKLHFRVVI